MIRKIKTALAVVGLCLGAVPALHAQPGTMDVAILSLNDFHGAFVQNDALGIPGAPNVLQTIDSLRAVYPHHLVVSAGDNFGGSFFYNATKGMLLPVFFNEAGIRLSAVGNHEFDDGQESMARKWADSPLRPQGWDLAYVCANVLDSTGQRPPYMQPYATYDVPLSATKSARIALVGLLASSAKEQISARRIVGMTFRGDYTAVLDELAAQPGFEAVSSAPIRALLMHIGTQMVDGSPVWFDKNEDELQRINGPLYQAFLTGHSHDPVCGRINASEKPVVQGWWHGNYISVMKFRVDTTQMAVVSVEPELVRVPLRPRTALMPHAARLQAQIDSLLTHTTTEGGMPIGTQLTTATADLPHDRAEKYTLSEVGTLVCAAYARAFRQCEAGRQVPADVPVVGVSHFGSVRAGFSKGPVSVLEVGEVLPFNNHLRAFRVSGKLLRELTEFGYHNERYGWMQYAGLDVERDTEGHVRTITYVQPETRQRVPVADDTECYLVADEFMSNGGDGYSPDFFPAADEVPATMPNATDAFINYLMTLKSIPLNR